MAVDSTELSTQTERIDLFKEEVMPFLDLGISGDRAYDSIAYTIPQNYRPRLAVKD